MSTDPNTGTPNVGSVPVAAAFVMHGAREILVLMPGAVFLERQIQTLEVAVLQSPDLALDLSRTLVESICKTILNDRGQQIDDAAEGPQLLRETLRCLRLTPDAHPNPGDLTDRLKKTVGGLNTVIQGICELRNKYGFASHGKTADFPSLEPVQAQLVARSADALVHFLMSAHKSYPSQFSKREPSFEDLEEINRRIDEDSDVVKILTYEYRPSEVLFKTDPLAYRDVVTAYSSAENSRDDEETS